jgi:hypothetical protein
MLERLHLVNVGPAPEMTMELGPRLNIITGDNGLGKSFLLDVAWWAMTRTWASLPVRPAPEADGILIKFEYRDREGPGAEAARFERARQSWHFTKGGARNLDLVLYAQVDGGFAVWDPVRNAAGSPGPYRFRREDVWDGLEVNGNVVCNGLIRDWVSWQRESTPTFNQLEAALEVLSPSKNERLRSGEPTRISLTDVRDVPTLQMPYGQDVAVLHASAGMQRILQLAYLMVWAWHEHRIASNAVGQPVTGQVVVLIDEIDSHLHPLWQRVILPSLLDAADALTSSEKTTVQVIASTHSPLVLASLETRYNSSTDAWFDLDLEIGTAGAEVVLRKRAFVRQGDVSNWLTSEAFDLKSARSKEAEEVLERASQALADEQLDKKTVKALDAELRRVLGDVDPFWMRWRLVGERRGWLD